MRVSSGCRRLASAPGGRWVQRGPRRRPRTAPSSWTSPGSPLWHCGRTYRTPPIKREKKRREMLGWEHETFCLPARENIYLLLFSFSEQKSKFQLPEWLQTNSGLACGCWQLYDIFWKMCHSRWQPRVSPQTQKYLPLTSATFKYSDSTAVLQSKKK